MSSIKTKIAALLIILLTSTTIIAAEGKAEADSKPKATLRDPAEFQQVIDEYKAYVAKISPEIRDEVIAFRKDIAKLNKKKKILYRKLSQESQDYLKQEQSYKKKLPLKRKSLINIDEEKRKRAMEKMRK